METGILAPELKTIESLFTGNIKYKVPKYQRSYSWGTDEIDELWEDIKSSIKRPGDYFLGTIVLQNKPDSTLEIIDGQQRLASLTIIISAIRNYFVSTGDDRAGQLYFSYLGGKSFIRSAVSEPKLVLNEVNNPSFVKYIINSSNLVEINSLLKEKTLIASNKLLLQAYKYYLEEISTSITERGTDSDEFIVPLLECITKKIKLITITVTSEEDANLFFESLNARGKELAVSDLVKNKIYFASKDQIDSAQQLWKQMENELLRKPIPEFLRHYWIAKMVDQKGSLVREKQLYKLYSQVTVNQTKTIELLSDLGKSAKHYAMLSDYNLWPDNDIYDKTFQQCLEDLQLFRVTQTNPILLNTIQIFESKPKDLKKIFQIVANFSFRYFIIGNQSPGNLERESSKIAYEIRNQELKRPKDVSDAFLAINPDNVFKNDFSVASFDKSNAKMARFVLSKINNFQTRQAGEDTISNPDAKFITLEHILPQGPGPVWTSLFKPSEINEYIYRIGNLTLLTKGSNNDNGNIPFPEKKKEFTNSKLKLNRYFDSINCWNAEEINNRQIFLSKIACDVWKISG